jgi:hypothetical protein
MKLKFHSFELLMLASPEAVFCHLKTVTSKQGENQNVQDCTHQIPFKINYKC